MVGVPSRHRSLALLTGVLLAQVLMLAVQVKRDSRGRLIRVWSMTAVTPFEKGGAWGFGKIRGVWDHYFALQGTTRQNEELRNENDELKLEISQLQSKAAEADRLATLLNFRQSHLKVPMVMARVIGASASSASHTVEIDRGERDGIRRNMAVITPDGAVGKIIECYRDTAQVLLLNDKDGGAGAMLVGSRIQSPVKGTGEPMLSMSYVAAEETVNAGRENRHQRHGQNFSARRSHRHGAGCETGQSLQADSREAGRAAGPAGRSDCAADAGVREFQERRR